jgi:hypothetical protein
MMDFQGPMDIPPTDGEVFFSYVVLFIVLYIMWRIIRSLFVDAIGVVTRITLDGIEKGKKTKED